MAAPNREIWDRSWLTGPVNIAGHRELSAAELLSHHFSQHRHKGCKRLLE